MKKSVFLLLPVLALMVIGFENSFSDSSEIYPLNNEIGVKKITTSLFVPQDNSLPWAFVEGEVINPVDGYPVIIQVIKDGSEPYKDGIQTELRDAHFAQVSLTEDNSYEYKFRVLDSSLEDPHIFEGRYTVMIFKVIHLPDNFASVSS